MSKIILGGGSALLWCASLVPAVRLWAALLLAMTPLAGMICDDPQTPCLRIIGGSYLPLFSTAGDVCAILFFLIAAFRTSWEVSLSFALAFNALNWAPYWLALGPYRRP